jgi:hypothetical protein
MKFDRCPNPVCGRPFQVNRFDAPFAGGTERGKITCPHCGLLVHGDSQSVFLTHALSPDQESDFDSRHPLEQRSAHA